MKRFCVKFPVLIFIFLIVCSLQPVPSFAAYDGYLAGGSGKRFKKVSLGKLKDGSQGEIEFKIIRDAKIQEATDKLNRMVGV